MKVNPRRPRTVARTLTAGGRPLDALDLAKTAPDWVVEQTARADRYRNAGDLVAARRLYEKVLDRMAKKPWRMLTALYNYGAFCHSLAEHAVAIHCFRHVLRYAPTLAEAWYNLGTALQETRACAEAVTCFERALALRPRLYPAWINLGNAKMGLGDMAGAEAAFAEAATIEPEGWEATYHQAHHLVLTGRWLEGWAKYESRWSIPGFTALNAVTYAGDAPTPWRGQPLSGCSLVVCGEQGWGDDILCFRYAPQLRAMGATVTWAVRDGLVRLAEASLAPDRVLRLEHDPLPAVDYCITTMSLHHRLRVTPETVPGADGYLRAA